MSTIIGRDRLVWNELTLYHLDELLYEVVPDEVYPNMFRVKWPDGTLSEDFYNLTRAKDHCIRLALGELNIDTFDKE